MRPAHRVFSFLGDFRVGSSVIEQWQFGIRMRPADPLGDSLQDDVNAAYDAFVTHMLPHLKESGFFLGVQGADVDADGTWATNANGSFRKAERLVTIQGSGGVAANLPRQSAIVLSLVTDRAGPTGKGRIFFPLQQAGLDPDGRITAQHQANLCTSFANFITELNEGGSREVVVASSKGYLSTVTAVKVGRTVDTMRSRRRDQPEAYTLCPVTVNPI